MKMLRVVLVALNFLEAPNGRNQRPAGAVSLRERWYRRDINPHAAPNDSRAVALRTRKYLAKPIVAGPDCNIVVQSGIGSAGLRSYKRVRTSRSATTASLSGYVAIRLF